MNIKQLLHDKNLSIYRLSKLSKLPYSTIRDFVSGTTQIQKMNVATAIKIAKALNTTVENLVYVSPANMAEFENTVPFYTKQEYYRFMLKYRKNVILRGLSALEYLNISNGNLFDDVEVYSTVYLPEPYKVIKVENFKYIDYIKKDGILITTVNKSINDIMSDKRTSIQTIDEVLSNYYYSHNESYDGLIIEKRNRSLFNIEKEIAKDYYNEL